MIQKTPVPVFRQTPSPRREPPDAREQAHDQDRPQLPVDFSSHENKTIVLFINFRSARGIIPT